MERFVKLINQIGNREKFFEFIISNSPSMIFVNDLDGNFMYSNRLEIIGYTEDELDTFDVFSLVHPDDQASFKDYISNIKPGEISKNLEYRYLHKDGHYVYLSSDATFIMDDKKNNIAVLTTTRDITQTQELMKNLSDSEKKYRNLFESSNAGICFFTFDGRVIEANKAAAKIFGYSLEEYLEVDITNLYSDQEELEELFSILNEQGFVSGFEARVRTKQNAIKWIKIRMTKFKLDNKEQILSIFTDIDKKKRLENDLKKSEQLYQDLYDNDPDMYCSVDAKTAKIVKCNHTLANKLGYTKEEIIGQEIFNIYHPSILSQVRALFQQFKDTGIISNEYLILQKKDGGKIDVSLNVTSIYNELGEPILSRSAWRDISIQKQAEREAFQSSSRYQKLFENMIDGFAYHKIILEDGKPIDYEFLIINDAFTKITGITREMVIGKRVTEALPGIENDPADWIGVYGDIALNQTSNYFESKSESLGKTFLVHAYCPEKGYFVTIFTDISDQKKAEEDRLRYLKNESLSILAGGIAHDYNNLLVGILGNVTLMQLNNNLDSKLKNSLIEVEKATHRASDLTNQLLTFSKGGAPITNPESIKSIIDESISFVLRGSKCKSVIHYAEHLPIVEVDAGQISQLINNIVINADQSMPEGGKIKIEVITTSVFSGGNIPLKEGKYVKISIEDEGIGINENIIPRIFDPYFTTKATGSGLGLATSYSIVKRHNGYINVESEEGKGSKFLIYLPASDKDKKIEIHDAQALDSFEGRILFLDDDKAIQNIMYDILNHLGFDVDLADDGNKVIELYTKSITENNPYTLVITDLTVPGGMGGKETLDRLLKIDPNVTAIVSSGYSNDPVLSDFENYGFKGRLIKPYGVDQIRQVISNCLNMKSR